MEKAFEPDLIHLNGYAHAALRWRNPVLVVAHSCVYSWYASVKGRKPSVRWETYARRVTEGLHSADLVVAPSKSMLASLGNHYGSDFGSSKVIYNGCPPEKFEVGEKEPFLLAAGRVWDEGKNIAVLREVASRVDWPVYVAGETTHPEGGDVPLHPLNGLGYLSPAAMRGWLGRASIFLSPARYEPFGLSVLEAGLAGCALILADIPSFREIWQDAACFVAPAEEREWHAIMNRMIANEGFRVESARKARQRALVFSAERMGRVYLAAYETTIRNRIRNESCSFLSIPSLGLESR